MGNPQEIGEIKMAKTNKTKKVDYKGLAKEHVAEVLKTALVNAGFELAEGEDYGFKAGSIIVNGIEIEGETVAVKVELTAPKAGVMTYEDRLEDAAE